jgi:hypothetical protein
MLPCTGGGAACDRKIELDQGQGQGKDILVPVFAAMAYGPNAAQKARIASTPLPIADGTGTQTECSLDGQPLDSEYIETEFRFGKEKAASSGYWYRLSLKSLSKGKHLVKFGGIGYDGFFTKVMYEVTVR